MRFCGDAVLLDFAAVFAGIFTLSCGIGVLPSGLRYLEIFE